ncbi:MAG: PfkB family carbohydrate kinase [Eubacteriales bacterium]|nr:PfkB family carbohydrate kinase [Eubacteriales bacterium]
MKLIAIGDNVTDCYVDEGVYFPGGNAVNVAVNCKKNGAEAVAYIGVLGDDENAAWIEKSLREEGVELSRIRRVYAHSAKPRVYLKDGDRVFGRGPRDSCQHLFAIRIVEEDLAVIRGYDVCHTSCYSNLEYELPLLSETLKVSFDFSDRRDEAYLERVCPYISYAFFSGADLSEEECIALMEKAHALGTAVTGVTRGGQGSLFYDGKRLYRQGICRVEAVDTMGAGDSFIAGFLTKYTDTEDMETALHYAAERAAATCMVRGGFGHPHPLSEEEAGKQS